MALYLRRPDEPATTPLLVAAACLPRQHARVRPGLPALALATGGPLLWLYNINIVGAYAIAWGALAGLRPAARRHERRRWSSPSALRVAYLGPPVLTAIWLAVAGLIAPNLLSWFDLVYTGTTVLVVATLVSAWSCWACWRTCAAPTR